MESQALTLVEEAEIPVTVDYIARKLDCAWGTGRVLLLGLAIKGKIEAKKTMKSWIFWIDHTRNECAILQDSEEDDNKT